MIDKPIAAGRSSYSLIDSQLLLSELPLTENIRILDAACGSGAYSIAVAEGLPVGGLIYAVDLWREGIAALKENIKLNNLRNIKAKVVDLRKELPMADDYFDLCLLATVWHDFIAEGTEAAVIKEIKRVLKPSGMLAVVEFKKIDGPPGPPLKIRLSPAELDATLSDYGFKPRKIVDLEPYNYLSLFSAEE